MDSILGASNTRWSVGMASILESLWPATALACLVRRASGERHRSLLAAGGGLFVALTAFAFEWHQQHVQGRVGDITTVLLMLGAWVAVWRVPVDHVDASADAARDVGSRSRTKRRIAGIAHGTSRSCWWRALSWPLAA